MWLSDVSYLTLEGRLGHADLGVESGLITEMAPAGGDRPASFDCSPYIVLPGLVNAHFHCASTVLRGLDVGLELIEWGGESPQGRLQDRLFKWLDDPAEAEGIAAVCRKEYLDLLRQGVTFVADSGFGEGLGPQESASLFDEVGLRGCVDAYDAIDTLPVEAFCAHLPEEEDMTSDALDAAVRRREQLDPIFMTHCLETDWRRDRVLADWGASSVHVFAEQGLLGPKTVLFHGCLTGDDDIAAIAAASSSIVHCPVSNLASTGLVAPTARWLDAGVRVAVGTDFANTNLWEALRVTWLLLGQQGRRGLDVARLVLRMATRDGALAYGRNDLGEIVVGGRADLALLDADAMLPYVDRGDVSTIAQAILTQGRSQIVRRVMVGGRWVLDEGGPTLVDGKAVDQAYSGVLRRLSA